MRKKENRRNRKRGKEAAGVFGAFLLSFCIIAPGTAKADTAATPQNAGRLETAQQDGYITAPELSCFLKKAKREESLLTGEKEESIPDSRFIVSCQEENDSRVISIASQAEKGEEVVFYVIGRDFSPNGTALAEWFNEGTVYSNLQEAKIRTEDALWYVARMSVCRSAEENGTGQDWQLSGRTEPSCLSKGTAIYRNRNTGEERKIYTAPLGHSDENGDSVCERCRKRTFPQEEGSKIKAVLGKRELTFTCIDEDFREGVPSLPEGGMLYLADQSVLAEEFGGYGSADYKNSQVRKYFRDGFQNGISVGEHLAGIQLPQTGETDYAMSLSKDEYERYRERISGGKFFLRDSEGGKVWAAGEDGMLELADPDDKGYGIRPAIVLKKPDPGRQERIHWKLGDLLETSIDKTLYLFRCIDETYSGGVKESGALFLCQSVIPANYGSDYRTEEQPDGSHRYVFQPGPFVNFGDTSDYKYSRVKKWLDGAGDDLYGAEAVQAGVDTAYTGKTPEGEFGSFDETSLKPHYIGNQSLTAKLFILSADEALKYREFLWKFEGEEEENPESQLSSFSRGFWLRSPMGNEREQDTGFVYVVDLAQGNIHPQRVKPQGGTGDEELDVTSAFGIRPAFVLKQN